MYLHACLTSFERDWGSVGRDYGTFPALLAQKNIRHLQRNPLLSCFPKFSLLENNVSAISVLSIGNNFNVFVDWKSKSITSILLLFFVPFSAQAE